MQTKKPGRGPVALSLEDLEFNPNDFGNEGPEVRRWCLTVLRFLSGLQDDVFNYVENIPREKLGRLPSTSSAAGEQSVIRKGLENEAEKIESTFYKYIGRAIRGITDESARVLMSKLESLLARIVEPLTILVREGERTSRELKEEVRGDRPETDLEAAVMKAGRGRGRELPVDELMKRNRSDRI